MRNIIQNKDSIEVQKQICQQKKTNILNSHIISTKLNKLCKMETSNQINISKEQGSQLKQEQY